MLRKLRFPALVGMTAGVLALVLCTGVPASARGNSCLGAKLKAVGKKESGLLGCSGDASGSEENIASLVDSQCVTPVVTVDAEGRVTDICSTDRIAASVLFAPTTLTALARSPSEIDLSWKDTNSSETGHLIERSLDAVTFVQIAAVGVNVHTYKNLGLTEKTTYYYRVRAYQTSVSGTTYSDYSNIASATTPADTTAPSTPSRLKAVAISCSEISLTWNGSTDSGSGVKGYNVYRGGVFLTQVPAPATSFTDSGLLPLTTYSYAVSAVDNAGNESRK